MKCQVIISSQFWLVEQMVGTKILLAQAANKYDEIGIDCVDVC